MKKNYFESNTDSIIIIVPCKNEEGNISGLVEQYISQRESNYKLFFVEGGSSDETKKVCIKFAEENKDKHIYFLDQEGVGKFAALLTVIDRLDSGLIVIWDSDNCIKFNDVKKGIELSQKNKIVVYGDRLSFMNSKKSMPLFNYLGNRIFSFAATKIFGCIIKDVLCGIKIFPLQIFKDINNNTIVPFKNDLFGDLSVVFLVRFRGLEVMNLRVNYYPRYYGKTSLKRFSNGLELSKNLFNSFLTLKLFKKRKSTNYDNN